MILTDTAEFLERVRSHNRETGHEIIEANDVVERRLGFACAECPPDNETVWEIAIRVALSDIDSPLNTLALLDIMNEHTRDRFFESGDGPVGFIPPAIFDPVDEIRRASVEIVVETAPTPSRWSEPSRPMPYRRRPV